MKSKCCGFMEASVVDGGRIWPSGNQVLALAQLKLSLTAVSLHIIEEI